MTKPNDAAKKRALARQRKKERQRQLKLDQERIDAELQKDSALLEQKRLQTMQLLNAAPTTTTTANPSSSSSAAAAALNGNIVHGRVVGVVDEEVDDDDNDDDDNGDNKTSTNQQPPPPQQQQRHRAKTIEYVPEVLDVKKVGGEFKDVFERFRQLGSHTDTTNDSPNETAGADDKKQQQKKKSADDSDNDNDDDDDDEQQRQANQQSLSKRKRKQLTRLSVAELKQLVARPDVVEPDDCNSANPTLLVALKGYRNVVPVPRHWSQKRKYLQGKRGFEKPPFELPQHIKDTGIAEVRDVNAATQDGKSMKQKARERMQPKAGKLDIDYQVLHDAFFVYQRKPRDLSGHGELYYEGKELEAVVSDKKPGVYSDALCAALGMKNRFAPPPWLYSMQRFGPPKSYPHLQVPGVNCPIPPGANWGMNEGEWGRPPVDVMGVSIWGGDVFGNVTAEQAAAAAAAAANQQVDKSLWGVIGNASDSEDSDDDDDDDDDDEDDGDDDDDDDQGDNDMDTTDGTAAAAAGATTTTEYRMGVGGEITPHTVVDETPLQLRKDGAGTDTPRTLYQVLEQKETSVGANELFGTSHTYVVPSSAKRSGGNSSSGVEVALNPEELANLDAESLKRKYQAQVNAEKAKRADERAEIDQVIEEETAKKKAKRRRFH